MINLPNSISFERGQKKSNRQPNRQPNRQATGQQQDSNSRYKNNRIYKENKKIKDNMPPAESDNEVDFYGYAKKKTPEELEAEGYF